MNSRFFKENVQRNVLRNIEQFEEKFNEVFFLFGNAILKQMLFTKGPPIPEIQARMENSVKTQQNVTNFVRVKIRKIKDVYFAKPISVADSRLLITLTRSDGVIIAKNRKELKKGESVKVITFRNITIT